MIINTQPPDPIEVWEAVITPCKPLDVAKKLLEVCWQKKAGRGSIEANKGFSVALEQLADSVAVAMQQLSDEAYRKAINIDCQYGEKQQRFVSNKDN